MTDCPTNWLAEPFSNNTDFTELMDTLFPLPNYNKICVQVHELITGLPV